MEETLHTHIDLSLILAATPGRAIGKDGDIPWHIPSDLKEFARITKEHETVIMGRKTWNSLPEKYRPLRDRRNIVLTTNREFRAPGAQVAFSPDEALSLVKTKRACIIGGAEVYRAFLPLVRTAYITRVDALIVGADTFYPPLGGDWILMRRDESSKRDPNDQYATSYEIWTNNRIPVAGSEQVPAA